MANEGNLNPLIAGRKKTMRLTLKDSKGAVVDMRLGKIFYMSKIDLSKPDAEALIDVVDDIPNDEDAENGIVYLLIPAAKVPISIVENGNVDPEYSIDYMLGSGEDPVNVSTGVQPIVKGVRNTVVWS